MGQHNTRALLHVLLGMSAVFSTEAQIKARINTDRVSVRAKASIFSEVVAQLRQGDEVTVLEVIKHQSPRQGEPAEWVKIKMPSHALLWVNSAHVDSARRIVNATRLNVRAGPGTNFTVVGSLNRGDPVKPVRVLDGWIEIEAPQNSWAFVNSLYLTRVKDRRNEGESEISLNRTSAPRTSAGSDGRSNPTREGAATRVVSAPASIATHIPHGGPPNGGATRPLSREGSSPEPQSRFADTQQDAPAPKTPHAELVAVSGVGGSNRIDDVGKAEPMVGKAVPAVDGGKQGRSVRREGVLVRSMAPQAPSPYRLKSVDTGRVIGFVCFENETGDVGRFIGRRVVINGLESSNRSSPNIPMIHAAGIELVER